jgi:hypothetical protein
MENQHVLDTQICLPKLCWPRTHNHLHTFLVTHAKKQSSANKVERCNVLLLQIHLHMFATCMMPTIPLQPFDVKNAITRTPLRLLYASEEHCLALAYQSLYMEAFTVLSSRLKADLSHLSKRSTAFLGKGICQNALSKDYQCQDELRNGSGCQC